MTVATTRTNEYTIGQIVTVAFRRAGLLNRYQTLDATAQGEGQQELQLVCDELEGRGLMSRSTEFKVIELTAGTSEYDLPTYTLAVVNRAMYIPAGDTDPSNNEQVIQHISQEDWQTLSGKTSQSTPSCYFHRRDVVPNQVVFWPVPNEDGSVRLQIQRLRADTSDGTKTVDFERYWMNALILRLSSQLCFNAGFDERGTRYATMSEEAIARCLSNAQDQAGFQMAIPAGRWSR
jgi:hypothetical protein